MHKWTIASFKIFHETITLRDLIIIMFFYQDFSASEDFHYIQRLEGESVDIDCVAEANEPRPPLLLLRRRFAHSESMQNISENEEVVRADPETEGRINISGQLNSRTVTLTLSHLRATDTGLYVCDFSGDPSFPLSANTTLFLLVKAAGWWMRWYQRHRSTKA